MNTYTIAAIPGDGIGKEVLPAGIQVLQAAAAQGGFRCEFTDLPWGSEFYRRNGRMMDPDGVQTLMRFDAIYFGAIGDPSVPDHITARELLLPLAST
jgi:tartrate dehydrogenase/decarboxylase/D-malate dehydrogenase